VSKESIFVPQILISGYVQDGIAGLADMDATFPHLQAQRIAIEEFLKASANGDPDAAEPFGAYHDESKRGNTLLPSMNQVWPQLVPCLRHTQPAVKLLYLFLHRIHRYCILNVENLFVSN